MNNGNISFNNSLKRICLSLLVLLCSATATMAQSSEDVIYLTIDNMMNQIGAYSGKYLRADGYEYDKVDDAYVKAFRTRAGDGVSTEYMVDGPRGLIVKGAVSVASRSKAKVLDIYNSLYKDYAQKPKKWAGGFYFDDTQFRQTFKVAYPMQIKGGWLIIISGKLY